MITAIVTFVLLLALGYIIFVHSGKQEGVNKTIGYVVIGVIAVAVIAVPVYSLARGLGGRGDFSPRGPEGQPGMQGGMFAPGFPQQGQGGMQRFRDFGNCPESGMQQCPQGNGDDLSNRQGNQNQDRGNGRQFRGMPFGGQGMPNGNGQQMPFNCQPPQLPGQQYPGNQQRIVPPTTNPQPGTQPAIPGTQQGGNLSPDAKTGNTKSPVPNKNN